MTIRFGFLALGAVALSALAQIILKYGMSSTMVQKALTATSGLIIIRTLATSWGVIAGIALYIASMSLWLFVLAKLDVSQAYPCVGAGFLITMVFAYFFLWESISFYRVVGTVLVTVGVYLVLIK